MDRRIRRDITGPATIGYPAIHFKCKLFNRLRNAAHL